MPESGRYGGIIEEIIKLVVKIILEDTKVIVQTCSIYILDFDKYHIDSGSYKLVVTISPTTKKYIGPTIIAFLFQLVQLEEI